jgi:hypothetical protein
MAAILAFVRKPALQADGTRTVLGISTATVVMASPCRLLKVTGIGKVYDANSLAAIGAACLVCVVGGTATLAWPCLVGIVLVPDEGAMMAANFVEGI